MPPTVNLITAARNVERVFLLHIARTGTDLYLANVDCTYDSVRYDRRIYEDVKMVNALGETFKPVLGPIRVKVACANHDAQLDTWHAAEDLRGLAADLTRVDMAGGNTETVSGTIIGVEFGIEGQITLDLRPVVELYQPLVSKVGTDTFPSAIHSDRGIPWVWGNAKHVPCPCINEDTALDVYDFVVAEGEVPTCDEVRRNGVTVDSGEYTYYDGTQGSPYPGYAFLRFTVQQRDFSGNLYEITADVQGLSRNFATNIKSAIVDGLGLSANAANFTTAAAAIPAAVYCDGYDADPNRKVHDIINEMMFCCRGQRLYKNTSGEWCLTIDASKSSSYNLGYGDGYYNNVFDIKSVTIAESAGLIQELKVNYRRAGSDYRVYNTRAGWTGIGENRSYDIRYLWDHTAADYVTCYHVRKNTTGSAFIQLTCNDEIRGVEVGNVVTLTSPIHSISAATYEVIKRTESENGIELTVRAYSTTPYTYAAGTLPSDEGYPEQDTTANYPESPDFVRVKTSLETDPLGVEKAGFAIVARATDNRTRRIVLGYKPADSVSTVNLEMKHTRALAVVSPSKDTYIDGTSTTTSYGTAANLDVRPSATTRRSLIQFDLSAYSRVYRAELWLNTYFTSPATYARLNPVEVYRCDRTDWTTGATWEKYDGTNPWTTPGGDFNSSFVANTNCAFGRGVGWYSWDVTSLCKEAIAERSGLASMLLKVTESGDWFASLIHSSRSAVTALRPVLVIYTNERALYPGGVSPYWEYDLWEASANGLTTGVDTDFTLTAKTAFEVGNQGEWDSIEATGDAYIFEGAPTTNYGTNPLLIVWDSTGNRVRSLLNFDLSGLATDITGSNSTRKVAKAELRLYHNNDGVYTKPTGRVYDCHILTKQFVEGEATWNNAETAVAWSAGGGDYESTLCLSSNTMGATYGWETWDVTDAVNLFLSSLSGYKMDDCWFVIKDSLENNSATRAEFYSSDYATAALRPQLYVYTSEMTTALAADATAPSAPTGVTATGQLDSIRIAWTKNSETDIEEYIIYRGVSTNPTTEIGRTKGTDYLDEGVSAGSTLYYYRVMAQDYSKNPSGYSSNVSAKANYATSADIAHSPNGTPRIFYQGSGSTCNCSHGGDKDGNADGQSHWYTTGGTEIANIGKKTYGADQVVGWFDAETAGVKYGLFGKSGTSGTGVRGYGGENGVSGYGSGSGLTFGGYFECGASNASGYGCLGTALAGTGVKGSTQTGVGVYGRCTATGVGVHAENSYTALALKVTGRIGSDQHAANTSAGNKTHRIPYYDGSNNFVGYIWVLDA